MPNIDDIHDAIDYITEFKVCITRRQAIYDDQYNRLRSILNDIARQYGFSPDSVTQVITSPIRPGDYSVLVAGWVYRERIKLANSRRRLDRVIDRTWPVMKLYSMDQIRSWRNRLSCDDIPPQTLQRIASRTIPTPAAFFVLNRALKVEICKLYGRIQRVEAITPETGIALLIEGGDGDSSGEDEAEDDSSDEN
ncbi:hypothetical protein QBC41DRAFT_391628 [Cercophora samala]|uniref:Uncharacterized protein n=1 Tax=Cercophora samala TaxID=330535 RepID=A0AA40DAT1_9PEZI|nr:hypothetical protein QBC41DRAFT_391628 [Cercophora samala]